VEAIDTEIPGVRLVRYRRHGDARGWLAETWSRRAFAAAGIDADFVQDNHSYSAEPGTVRGLHFQRPPAAQAKLVRVLAGAVLDVAADIRPGSPTFGRHVAVRLSADEPAMLFVPEGFAHGFCTLAPDTEVAYRVTAPYAPELEGGVAWDDPDLAVPWPVDPAAAVLSERDRRWPRLADLAAAP